MREAINFSFDGVASEEMGVIIASPSGGLFEDIFLPNRSIIETQVANRNKPYFQRVESEPLSFSLTFFIHEWRERDNLRQIARWLMTDYYKPLVFESNPDRVFYALFEGSSSLFHNGCKDGYITLNVRCNSPYTYSHKQVFEGIEVEESTSKNTSINIFNSGDMAIMPKIWITKRKGNGSISIKNLATNQEMKFTNIQDGEQVFIDAENEEIISDLEYLNVFRYDNHNDVWLELAEGENTLIFTGDFYIEIEYQMIYLTD